MNQGLKRDKKRINKNKSFTLIEILVSISIFTLVIFTISGVFIASVKNQRRTIMSRQLLDQTSYVFEYISRALRMARKDLTGSCITAGSNYENSSGDSSIRFIKFDYSQNKEICYEFFLEDGVIKEKRSSDSSSANFGQPIALTSTDLKVNFLKFQLSGERQPPIDNLQPKVTILLDIEATRVDNPPKLKIQTTISQRDLDIQQ